MPRRAGVLLMATGGKVKAKSTENFETACRIDEDVELHPFGVRAHAHKLGTESFRYGDGSRMYTFGSHSGKVVTGWRVKENRNRGDQWKLFGKVDPQLPQVLRRTIDTDHDEMTVA